MKPISVTPTGPVFSARLDGLTPPGTYVLVVGKTATLTHGAAETVQEALTAPRPVSVGWVGTPPDADRVVPLPGSASAVEVRVGPERPLPAGYKPMLTAADFAGPAYTGSICGTCGSAQVVRTGACETCQSCGSTSSCG